MLTLAGKHRIIANCSLYIRRGGEGGGGEVVKQFSLDLLPVIFKLKVVLSHFTKSTKLYYVPTYVANALSNPSNIRPQTLLVYTT